MRDYQYQWALKHIAVSGVWNTVYLYLLCYSWFRELEPASITGLAMSTVQGQEDKHYKLPNMMKYTVYIRALCTEYTLH